jgi:mRNA deadenylase 3'-5' endonuclease subunit Ccr4
MMPHRRLCKSKKMLRRTKVVALTMKMTLMMISMITDKKLREETNQVSLVNTKEINKLSHRERKLTSYSLLVRSLGQVMDHHWL